MAVDLRHPVFKAENLFQDDFPVFHMAEDMPSAGCPDIYSEKIFFHISQITPFCRMTLA